MRSVFALLVIPCLILAGCREEINMIPVEIDALRASSLYHLDSVYNFLSTVTDKHKEIAENFQKRANDVLKSDSVRAIYLLKRAASLYPTEENYQLLGGLLKATGKYKEAADVYSFLMKRKYDHKITSDTGIFIFSKPSPDTWYNYISTEIASSKFADPFLFYDAKENGIDIQYLRKKLEEDRHLGLDRSSAEYKNILVSFWTEDEITRYRTSKEAFEVFLRSAKDTLKTFSIPAAKVADFDFDKYVDFQLEALSLTDFNRHFLEESAKEDYYGQFNLGHAFNTPDGLHAVTYALDNSASGCIKELRNIKHKLVIYDRKGNPQESLVIASQNADTLVTCDINFPRIEIKYYLRKWKEPVTEGQIENEILGETYLMTEKYEYRDGSFILTKEL